MRRALIATLLIGGLVALSACETAKGFGRDVTNAANAVDKKI